MLELTRRMTLSRTSFTRIAGCYVDRDGDFEGSFNTNFLKLSAPERTKKLKLAKEIPFSPTNVNLKKYEFREGARKPGSMWQLLMAMNECGLKNDALCRLPRYLTKPRQRRSEWDMAGSDGISRVSAVFRGKTLLTNKMRII